MSAACPLAPTLFFSLLNAALSYDPVGWGVPYASALVSDTAEPLAGLCLQARCVLCVCVLQWTAIVTARTVHAALRCCAVL